MIRNCMVMMDSVRTTNSVKIVERMDAMIAPAGYMNLFILYTYNLLDTCVMTLANMTLLLAPL